ncbi:MAG: serine/threonine-protein kinase [Planctomycetota bacterium]
MPMTTRHAYSPTITLQAELEGDAENELTGRYRKILANGNLHWTNHFHLGRLLGQGGQGAVFLTQLRGADQFTVPVAIKLFSPERYADANAYAAAMARAARVAARVTLIQHDKLLDIHNFLDRDRIRMMVMEWVDGFDLAQLLIPQMLEKLYERVSARRWEYLNRVIVTAGSVHPRIKPGVAVAIVRDCLSALAALHREGVVHSDIKPSNIMLKRTGTAKIIDIGSAFEIDDPPPNRACTPAYAAPEVLEFQDVTPLSDLASLGYVLIEMLAGRPLFAGLHSLSELLDAKRTLPQRLKEILPADVTVNELLMKFCRGLIAPQPRQRFESAETAEMNQDGAAGFHRQLVKGDLASEYSNDIRLWLEELKDCEEHERSSAPPTQ